MFKAVAIGPCDFNHMQCWRHLLILWDVTLLLAVVFCDYSVYTLYPYSKCVCVKKNTGVGE